MELVQLWYPEAKEFVLSDRLTGVIVDRQSKPFDNVGMVLEKP